jgi:hypothetical protein
MTNRPPLLLLLLLARMNPNQGRPPKPPLLLLKLLAKLIPLLLLLPPLLLGFVSTSATCTLCPDVPSVDKIATVGSN